MQYYRSTEWMAIINQFGWTALRLCTFGLITNTTAEGKLPPYGKWKVMPVGCVKSLGDVLHVAFCLNISSGLVEWQPNGKYSRERLEHFGEGWKGWYLILFYLIHVFLPQWACSGEDKIRKDYSVCNPNVIKKTNVNSKGNYVKYFAHHSWKHWI